MNRTVANPEISEEPSSVYHYTSFDTFVKIWLGKKLKFGEIMLMNDICDAEKMLSTPFFAPGSIERYSWAQNIVSPYKQLSFTKDYKPGAKGSMSPYSDVKGSMSPYMWGHYGDKRKGVCIEFDFKSFTLDESMTPQHVGYVKRLKMPFGIPATLKTESEIKEFMRDNKTQLFFTKSEDWEAENEYRIISDKADWLNFQEESIKSVCITNPAGQECEFLENLLPASIPVMWFNISHRAGYYFPEIHKAKDYRELCAINRSLKPIQYTTEELIEGTRHKGA